MFCPSCGIKLDAPGTACTQCGAVVPTAPGTMSKGEQAMMRVALPVGRDPVAIIAGYMGLFAILVVFAPLSLGLGIWALVRLKRRPQALGRGRAWFAVIMGLPFTLLLGYLVFDNLTG